MKRGNGVLFNGLWYGLDKKTGYYRNNSTRKRLHQAVWEFSNGEIPTGHIVHHIDHDKTNNEIANLTIIPKGKHSSVHATELNESNREYFINKINHARKFASEWHGSQDGIEWHKTHGKEVWKNKVENTYSCSNCGKNFETKNSYGEAQNAFCSNACKSAFRRKNGTDNESRICLYCGKVFEANKYSKTKVCSQTCSNRQFPRLPQLRKN